MRKHCIALRYGVLYQETADDGGHMQLVLHLLAFGSYLRISSDPSLRVTH